MVVVAGPGSVARGIRTGVSKPDNHAVLNYGLTPILLRRGGRALGVCDASVYKLCARGHLGHVRILNAIRVARARRESKRR
jgi:hypothetical protein